MLCLIPLSGTEAEAVYKHMLSNTINKSSAISTTAKMQSSKIKNQNYNVKSKILYFYLSFFILIFTFSFFLLPSEADAALIIQAPKYIGLNSGLVGYWSFNAPDMAGNTAYDRSGQGNNGTLTGGPTRAIGKIGQALSFDGVNDYVDVGDPASGVLDVQTGDMTISGWIYMRTTDEQYLAAKSDCGDPNEYLLYGGTGGNKPGFRVINSAGTSFRADSVNALNTNSWYHLVGVKQGSNIYLYINGAWDNTLAISGTFSGNTLSLMIGRRTTATCEQFLDGLIDDVRVYNRALSADEIKRLYRIGATLKINTSINNDSLANGLVGYWSMNAPDVAGTTAYDRSGNAKNGSALGQDIDHTGLVGWWKLDEGSGTSAGDSSGQGNTGTLAASPGTPTWTTGKIGSNALNFDGTDDNVSATVVHNIGTGSFSMTAWVKPNSLNADYRAIISDSAYSPGFFARLANGEFGLILDGTNELNSGQVLNIGEWQFLVGVRDGSAVKFFYNGAQTSSNNTSSANVGTSDNFEIGRDGLNGDAFAGLVDDVRIYNRAISAAEVAKLYNYALPKFAPAVGRLGQGVDSTQSYVNSGNVSSSVNSFSFWMKTASSSPTVNLLDLNASQSIKIMAGAVTASGLTSPSIFVDGVSGTTVNAGWHHIAVTTGTAVNASAVNLGLNATTTAPLDGVLDDVRFYNRVINTDEIKRLYRIGATLKVNTSINNDSLTKGLVGYWSFDGKDMAGVTAYDRSGNSNNGTLTNGPTRAIGKIGQGLSFDGSNDTVSFGLNAIGPDINGVSAVTICGWMKLDIAPSDGAGLFAVFAGGGSTMLDIGFKSTLKAYVAGRSQTTDAYQQVNGLSAISLNTWAFICGVWDYPSDQILVYLNGALDNSGAVIFGATTYTHTTATVGADSISFNDASTLVDGLIDDVRIYNRALTGDEIKRLYNFGR